MTVDVLALTQQCIRCGVTPDPASTLVSAHALLKKLPSEIYVRASVPHMRVELSWLCDNLWTATIGNITARTGSFEDCVTAISERCNP